MSSTIREIDQLIHQINKTNNSKPKTIGTHHGTFHCDEVLACYMLSNHTKEYRNANIIRSRDPDVLSGADIVVDVGAVFDAGTNRFDHHQNTFNEQFSSEYETKLSSAGLIYKYFGKEIIKDIILNHSNTIQTNMDNDNKDNGMDVDDDNTLDILYKKIYESFIEGVDGMDNGIKQYDTDKEKRYKISTDLSSRIGNFNPWWNQATNDEIAMIQFKKAMESVGNELISNVLYIYKGWLPARSIVNNAINNRFDIHKSGLIMRLEQYCPWIDHLFEIHECNEIKPFPVYVLFTDTKGGWRIRATPVAVGSFDNIKQLPKIWCGKRSNELNQICGIDGCVFVHASGFIGGNTTYDGVLKMAEKAIEYKCDDDQRTK